MATASATSTLVRRHELETDSNNIICRLRRKTGQVYAEFSGATRSHRTPVPRFLCTYYRRGNLIPVKSANARSRFEFRLTSARTGKTETFGSMTFIHLFIAGLSGRLSNRINLVLVRLDVPRPRALCSKLRHKGCIKVFAARRPAFFWAKVISAHG